MPVLGNDSGETPPAEARDQRIDRAVTWALTTIAGLAFAMGAWAFTGLTNEVRGMRDDLARFSTRVAVLETGDAANRIRALEQVAAKESGQLAELERRISAIESHGGK